MDYQIFRLINNLAAKNAILDFIAIFFAEYLIWLLLFLVIVLGLLPPSKKRETLSKVNAARGILGAAIGATFTLVIGQFVSRIRPFVAHDVNLLIVPPLTPTSFPSLHTTIGFAFSCTLFLFNRKIGISFLAISLIIGLARVFVGVHYPSDIIFGAIIGCLSALIIKFISNISLKKTSPGP